jgi:hypothetical protein
VRHKGWAPHTSHLGLTLRLSFSPGFANVVRSNMRLLLSGLESSAGRPMPDGRTAQPGGWNRIVNGPGGQQILLGDPSGNPIELFQPAGT